jgi:acetyl-CoA acetyltransferase
MSTPPPRQGTRPVAIVACAQSKSERRIEQANEVELLMPVVTEVYANAGMTKDDVDFICSGSTDYLIGGPFSFVTALDAVGVWPPKAESHVEMDGAWALYEAWVTLQEEGKDVALVYGFGKSSLGDLSRILALQLDPYTMAPMWPDQVSLAALQAQAMIDQGLATEEDFARIASRARHNALSNPNAQVANEKTMEELMKDDYAVAPLRRHTLPPLSDGAAAIILVAGDRAYDVVDRPAWITGIDHRVDAHAFGARNLAESRSTTKAAENAGVSAGPVDIAELHAPFAHQEILLRRAMGLNESTVINPSGGPLAANPLMAGGLIRFIEAANRIMDGSANRAVAHATSGPVLQQNLVAVLEGAS